MTISICNRNQSGRRCLGQLILQYKKERNMPMLKILNYDSPWKLEADLGKVESDAYLLDIMFSGMSGIDLAKKIRKHDACNPIIFLTPSSRDDYNVSSAYALRYFVRPAEMYDLLDDMLKPGRGIGNDFYSLNTVEGRQNIRFGEIMYVERVAQVILITTASGKAYESVTLRESFTSKVRLLLADERFAQTHVSYLVNMDAVDRYQKNQMIMLDGRCIPISRKFIPSVKEKYNSHCC